MSRFQLDVNKRGSFFADNGVKYNPKLPYGEFDYFDANMYGGITKLIEILNAADSPAKQSILISAKWLTGYFANGARTFVNGTKTKILPVKSVKLDGTVRETYIIDTEYKSEQPGGSLYDNKGKLLYRGEMKNGVPHGYGTGYYSNGKVGHVGIFKGGKIVQ